MLEELDIKNFALIDSAHVEFQKGFTVLSGETGAGKSILIGSLAFLLGGKGGTEQIRTGTTEAQVCGTFFIEQKEAYEWLDAHGIEPEENRILVRRVIRDSGKSSAWIGGTPVTKADLLDFASCLVDIHGQHEQQSLMKVSEHRRYLDIYADIVDEVRNFTSLYSSLVEKRKLLDNLNTNETERRNRIDMLSFAVDEIDAARLKPGEDEELEKEENRLSSYEKLFSDIEEICGTFDGSESGGEPGILSVLHRLGNTVSHAAAMDKGLESLENRISSSFYELDDISKEFKHYRQTLVFDPEHLAEVQDRLELINKLKKKYASSSKAPLSEVSDYYEKAQKELSVLTDSSQDRESLEKSIAESEREVYVAAKQISDKRKAASEKMSSAIEEILHKLGMKDTSFRVNLSEKAGSLMTQKCGPYGMDDIEFLISANPGSPLMSLAKIASGGELSRVMLAMKTVLSGADMAGTLVFDEIDTGIGGEVAVSVGEHMKKLAANKQILCITHLASIAVYADNQIKIQKGVDGSSASTHVFPVSGDERVKEVARMLSGDATSAASLEHASDMLRKFGGL